MSFNEKIMSKLIVENKDNKNQLNFINGIVLKKIR